MGRRGRTRADEGHWPDHGVVFRAAAAVLAPDEAVVDAIGKATDPWYVPGDGEYIRRILHALRAHVETTTTTERTT